MHIYALVLSEDWITFYTSSPFVSFFFCSAVALSLTGGDDTGRSRGGTSGERAEGRGAKGWALSEAGTRLDLSHSK